jgi:hypothetical protein
MAPDGSGAVLVQSGSMLSPTVTAIRHQGASPYAPLLPTRPAPAAAPAAASAALTRG